ncbi:MAG: BamA/TamA family outer membrane protein, partial [Planctomycetota bacterium]|nr:BamA/TamA family outer membrane protein [Planctomycetota bacterium]
PPDGGGLPPALPNGGGLPPLPPGGVTNPRLNPIGTGEPPGGFPNVPGMNVNDVGPDRNDPFRNRSFADVLTSVEESPTGNFSLAFGASSFQGLYGMLTVAEKNFNIWNPPRTWDDILQGKSFRGGGQQLILTLMPGTVLNSAQLKFVEPYLFEQPITFSTTGYFNYRFYPNWTLSRGGTQIALGRLLSPTLFADVGMSAENVNFFGYRYPAPADYLAATGNTSLFSLRPSIRYDTRNSPFMASRGRYLQLAFQQGWGSFTFPKVEVEGRSYWTLFSRPDGSGPRVLEVRGFLGAAGRATPVYERFFAGNFGSLRGFQYYGVGPFQFGSNAGGIFEALGSVEYRFPLNARDTIYQVAFCDFGTVEQNYDFHNMRVSVGTGLRITLPFMPMPIAVDLAFPVSSAQGDVKQFFNFSVGATY